MVGRNDIVFSGYKSHRTTEHQKKKPRTGEKEKLWKLGGKTKTKPGEPRERRLERQKQ
jgi:hypothetical protein